MSTFPRFQYLLLGIIIVFKKLKPVIGDEVNRFNRNSVVFAIIAISSFSHHTFMVPAYKSLISDRGSENPR